MNKKKYLCIHGHFYQPPRENPWIEEIEYQDYVGGDYHDWNERISSECYRPNALARILDADQRIEDIVNNFEFISFNVGPTLLSWLERHDKRTYERMREADKASLKAHNGHGNAIAQVYNHVIMPLANRQDKVTQVRWGIADFRRRFGRQPEAMWLPETACNEETLEILQSEGLKFVILSPHQADKIRRISPGEWTDVSAGTIDPTHAYRYFLASNPQKFIDIFFYDGPVSKAVAFDDLTFDARLYADRLELAANPSRKHTQLIHVATDGETYGHHKGYADRALAYLVKIEAPQRGFVLVNYGEFLEKFPPEYEVKMKSGEENLGTSWSCIHGVKRWKEQCGCRGVGPAHWRQDWRKPLRETFDWLRDELAIIFAQEAGKYLKDIWAARDDYIDVILDRGEQCREEFFRKHAKQPLRPQEMITCLRLLEGQRNAMLMYTSCGWFFTELSGEETVQVIKYAARALQLSEGIVSSVFAPPSAFAESGGAKTDEPGEAKDESTLAKTGHVQVPPRYSGGGASFNLVEQFLRRLAMAKSNIEFFKDGAGVYDQLVRPSVVSLEKVVSHFAISSLFRDHREKFEIYCYEFENLHYRKETQNDRTLCFGRVKVRSQITLEEIDAVYVLLQSAIYDFYCYVRPFKQISDYPAFGHRLFNEFMLGTINTMGEVICESFGKEYFSLKDLFQEEKRHILELLSKEGIARFKEFYRQIYERHKRMIDVYRASEIPLPEEFHFVMERKFSDDFNALINERIFSHVETFDKAYAIWLLAEESSLKLNKAPARHFLTKRLNENMKELSLSWDHQKIKNCCKAAIVVEKLVIDIDWRVAQEYYLSLVNKIEKDTAVMASLSGEEVDDFLQLGRRLAINVDKLSQIKVSSK